MTTFPSPEDLAADVFDKMSTKASEPGTIAALGVVAGVYIALGAWSRPSPWPGRT